MKLTQIYFLFGIVFILNTISVDGQAVESSAMNNLLSNMDRMFNQADYVPTPEDEYYIGRAVAASILSRYRLYVTNPTLTQYLNLICNALVINISMPMAYNGFSVSILDSQEFNAFATPGGHIFLTKGLVEATPSEDALAAIIAHELAHIMLKHGMKMIEEMRIFTELDSAAQRAAAMSGNTDQQIIAFRSVVNELAENMIINGYSQEQEFEADSTALELLAAAGYSPNGLLEMLRVLQGVQGNQRGGFNSTHPAPVDRIANVERQIINYRVPDNSSFRRDRFNRNMER